MERADYERLRWRCIRRALLELDITLTRFLDDGFAQLNEEQQQVFAEMADLEDYDLWYMITGSRPCEDPRYEPILAILRKS